MARERLDLSNEITEEAAAILSDKERWKPTGNNLLYLDKTAVSSDIPREFASSVIVIVGDKLTAFANSRAHEKDVACEREPESKITITKPLMQQFWKSIQ